MRRENIASVWIGCVNKTTSKVCMLYRIEYRKSITREGCGILVVGVGFGMSAGIYY